MLYKSIGSKEALDAFAQKLFKRQALLDRALRFYGLLSEDLKKKAFFDYSESHTRLYVQMWDPEADPHDYFLLFDFDNNETVFFRLPLASSDPDRIVVIRRNILSTEHSFADQVDAILEFAMEYNE